MKTTERSTPRLQWAECVANADAAGAAALYSDEAKMLAPNAEPFEGRAAIQGALQAMIDAGLRSVAMEALEVKEGGDLIVEYGRYETELPGGAGSDVGKYIVVLERQDDDSLKIVLDMYSSNANPG